MAGGLADELPTSLNAFISIWYSAHSSNLSRICELAVWSSMVTLLLTPVGAPPESSS